MAQGKSRTQQLNGLPALAYVGVQPVSPINFFIKQTSPTANDYRNCYVGDMWLNNASMYAVPPTAPTIANLWILVSIANKTATWVNFLSGDIANKFLADDGNVAIPSSNVLYITGQTPLATKVPIDGGSTFEVGFTPATDGQLIIGATGGNPAWANLTSVGMTVTITNTPNGINLEAAGGGATTVTAVGDTGFAVTLAGSFNIVGGTNIATSGDNAQTLTISNTGNASLTWIDVTGTSQAMAINKGYTANNAGLVTLTLPSTAAYGSIFYVVGKGAGGWKIAQNSGQTIHFGSVNTTTGTGGYLASTLQYDVVAFICSVANTDFTVIQSVGDITYV